MRSCLTCWRRQSARYISFTTDSWTTSQCTDSLLSITAHWVTDFWDRQSAVVAACPFEWSHTAHNLAGIVTSLLEKWNIGSKVLWDNAKNMTAGLREAGVESVSCFSHTLQLCVKTNLASQRAIIDAVTTCRNVATHFLIQCWPRRSRRPFESQSPIAHAMPLYRTSGLGLVFFQY